MKTQSSDTSPAAEAVLIQLARELPPHRKLEIAFSMTNTVRQLARAGLRSRYPEAPKEEIDRRLAALVLPRPLVLAAYGWDPEAEGF